MDALGGFTLGQFEGFVHYHDEPPSGAIPAATFRGQSIVEANSGTVAWPSGTVAGDSAVILLFGNGSLTLTGTGWTPQDVTAAQINVFGSFYSAFHKVGLTSGDISSPPTYSGCDFGGIMIYVGQNATGINFITNTANVSGTTNTLTGFTKNAISSLIVTLVIDRTTTTITAGAPSGFSNRGQTITTFFTGASADIAATGYTSGTNVVWSGLESGNTSGAAMWEFLAPTGSSSGYLDFSYRPHGTIILCNINVKDPGAGISTLRFGSIGYNDPSAPGYYEDRILQLPTFQREISFGAALSGESSVKTDSLKLDNSDGSLDYLRDWGLAGQQAQFLIGDNGDVYTDFEILFTARLEQVLFDINTIEFQFHDRMEDLQKNIQSNKFAGTNPTPSLSSNREGRDDLKGLPKPLVFGQVYNVSPPNVATEANVFQLNDGAYDNVVLYDHGVVYTRDADYPTDDMSSTTAGGHYRANLAHGYLRSGSPTPVVAPAGSLTCDITKGSTAASRTAAQVALSIVTSTNGILLTDVQTSDVTNLDIKNSAEVGIWIRDETTVLDAALEVLKSVGAWCGFDRFGKFRMMRLDIPSNPIVRLSDEVLEAGDIEINEIRMVPTKAPDRGKPTYRVIVNYKKNYTVQAGDLVAGSVSTAQRNFLELEYRATDKADNSTTLANNPFASELTVQTLLTTLSDANTERDRLLALYSGRQDFFEIDVRLTKEVVASIDIGKDITLKYPRFNYDSGRVLSVTGVFYNPAREVMTISAWGPVV